MAEELAEPIKHLDCIRKNQLEISKFYHLIYSQEFRYNNQWNWKTDENEYCNEKGDFQKIDPETYIAANPNNILEWMEG